MTTTGWYTPTSITQNLDEDPKLIPWKTPLSFPVLTSKDLIHIAGTGGPGPAMTDLRNKTTMLTFTNYGFANVPDNITGIELQFIIDRSGRISDSDVYLCYNGQPIGINKTNYDQDEGGHLINFNKLLYGGALDLWGAELTPEILQDPSFGVMIRQQSHPFFPHRCGAVIRQVALRYYSA